MKQIKILTLYCKKNKNNLMIVEPSIVEPISMDVIFQTSSICEEYYRVMADKAKIETWLSHCRDNLTIWLLVIPKQNLKHHYDEIEMAENYLELLE